MMLWKFNAKLYNDWHMRHYGYRDKIFGWYNYCDGKYLNLNTHLISDTPYSADTPWCKALMTQKEMLMKVRSWSRS